MTFPIGTLVQFSDTTDVPPFARLYLQTPTHQVQAHQVQAYRKGFELVCNGMFVEFQVYINPTHIGVVTSEDVCGPHVLNGNPDSILVLFPEGECWVPVFLLYALP